MTTKEQRCKDILELLFQVAAQKSITIESSIGKNLVVVSEGKHFHIDTQWRSFDECLKQLDGGLNTLNQDEEEGRSDER